MHHYPGGCHCGTVRFAITLPHELAHYIARACDCRYCRQHGAAYLSDPKGRLQLQVTDTRQLSRYRQGSGIADFWVCKRCGVLTAVSYEEHDHVYATINAHALDEPGQVGGMRPASPRLLADPERIERWKTLWFSQVVIQAQ